VARETPITLRGRNQTVQFADGAGHARGSWSDCAGDGALYPLHRANPGTDNPGGARFTARSNQI